MRNSFEISAKKGVVSQIEYFNHSKDYEESSSWINAFFTYIDDLEPIMTSRDIWNDRIKNNKLLDFDTFLDKPVIFIPFDVSKGEVLDIIYQALLYIYSGSIPENHPFYELCERFTIEWILYYRGLHLSEISKKWMEVGLYNELEKISFPVSKILKSIIITKKLVKEIQSLSGVHFYKNNQGSKNGLGGLTFINEVLAFTKNHVNFVTQETKSFEDNFKLGHVSLELEDVEEAAKYFTNALGQKPDSLTTLEKLGEVYYKLGDREQAQDLFLKVYAKDKNYSSSHRHLCLIAYKSLSVEYTQQPKNKNIFKIHGVLRLHKSYLEKFGDDYDILCSYAHLLYELQKIDELKEVCLKIFEYDSEVDNYNLDILYYLVEIFFESKNDSMFKYHALFYLSKEVQSVDIWFLLRDYYADIGEFEIARLASIIATLYDGKRPRNAKDHLKYFDTLDLTQDDDKVLEYFKNFIHYWL